jgi:hypothetical protein
LGEGLEVEGMEDLEMVALEEEAAEVSAIHGMHINMHTPDLDGLVLK